MYLMLKDIPVIRFDLKKEKYTILRPHLLPHILRKLPADAPPARMMNAIRDFISGRVMQLLRSNAKALYSLVGNDQSQTTDNFIRISLLCHSVSVNDSYWIRTREPPFEWNNINIRRNPLNDVFTTAALQGTYPPMKGPVITPELTTDGTAAKGWKRENGKLWLYKKGNLASIEVLVSNLLDHFNVEHVKYYDAVDTDGAYCCKCCCLSDDKIHIVSAADISVEQDPDYKMWIVDYLISNVDRHNRNYGYYVDVDTTQVLRPHPLFDHDHAFGKIAMFAKNVPYKACPPATMQEAAHEALKYADLYYTKDFSREEFQTDMQYRSFMSRLIELRIPRR